MLLVSENDVVDFDMVLHDLIAIAALGVEIFEFVLHRHEDGSDSEGGDEVGHEVLVVEVVSEDHDVLDGLTFDYVPKKVEHALGSVCAEGIAYDEGLAPDAGILRGEIAELLQALSRGILYSGKLYRLDVEVEVLVVLLQGHGAKIRRSPVNKVQVDRDEVFDVRLKFLGISGDVLEEHRLLVVVVGALPGVLTFLADVASGHLVTAVVMKGELLQRSNRPALEAFLSLLFSRKT